MPLVLGGLVPMELGSDAQDAAFFVEALEGAPGKGMLAVFNTDHGSLFANDALMGCYWSKAFDSH